jgi:hypothetical protein
MTRMSVMMSMELKHEQKNVGRSIKYEKKPTVRRPPDLQQLFRQVISSFCCSSSTRFMQAAKQLAIVEIGQLEMQISSLK